ncbi:MAG TPA: [protein-PII] uridylyltransferase [Dongiaceae bacterium]|jgi:[protein-PII] uridylyltransferase|nr:[protein-PII] uridylyltransferase [Dongiaceae bacterium]
MSEIANQRAVLDRRALSGELNALAERSADPAGATAELQAILRRYLAEGRAEIRRRFEANPRGATAGLTSAHEASFLIDQLIRCLYDYAAEKAYPLANPTSAEKLTLAAVGGYGRGELAPYSDIDLLFLLPYKLTPHGEQVVEFMLYRLWDLGLKVGHAARTVQECIRQAEGDVTIRTNLLESRYLWGERPLYDQFRARFKKEIVKGKGEAFLKDKLAERKARHQRAGDSRYTLEPNIKEGKGGLRDLQTLLWIARFMYGVGSFAELVEQDLLTAQEVATYDKALNFLWTLRCHLHYLTGRPEERLTFDLQPEMARRLGYTDHAGLLGVERLMKHYFLVVKSVGGLTRYFLAAIDSKRMHRPFFRMPMLGLLRSDVKLEVEGFRNDGGQLSVANAEWFIQHPLDMIRIFAVSQKNELGIHPVAMTWLAQAARHVDGLRNDPEANRLFLEILTNEKDPELTLRRMSEAGVLGRFIPDFGRVVAQMQFDMYHHYTVDEHSLKAIGILWRIERGELKGEAPIASGIVRQVVSRRVLYLAVLLHDIAKGRGGDHSELGAEVAERLGPRLGLSAEETETVAWLVRYHLIMSNTAFRRDIEDPKTIADFVAIVQSVERLRLLLVLTVADIRAVGPKTWNGWKAQLLRELYNRAEETLSGGLITEGREARVAQVLKQLRAELPEWSDADFEAHAARGPAAYWLGFPLSNLVRQARLIRTAELEHRPLSIDYTVDHWRAMTEVTIYVADWRGLVSQLAGALALSGASIVDARIFTLKNGMALDSFTVQDSSGGPFDTPARFARVAATVERVLKNPRKTLAELVNLPPGNPAVRSFPVVPRVLIDNKASATHTLIEVTGRDRRGLMHFLTRALTAQNLQISTAKISTFGHRVVDVFYVKDQFGLKIESPARLTAIRDALMQVLQEREAEIAPPAVEAKAPAPAAQ